MPLFSLKSKEQHDLPNHADDKYCSPHQCVCHNNNDHRYPREMLCVKHVATMCIEYELIIGALQQLVLTGLMSVWFITPLGHWPWLSIMSIPERLGHSSCSPLTLRDKAVEISHKVYETLQLHVCDSYNTNGLAILTWLKFARIWFPHR